MFMQRTASSLSLLKDTFLVAYKVFVGGVILYSMTCSITVCVGAFAARLMRRPHVWHLHEFGFEDQGLSFVFGQATVFGVG